MSFFYKVSFCDIALESKKVEAEDIANILDDNVCIYGHDEEDLIKRVVEYCESHKLVKKTGVKPVSIDSGSNSLLEFFRSNVCLKKTYVRVFIIDTSSLKETEYNNID
jgi:hypothetical protein